MDEIKLKALAKIGCGQKTGGWISRGAYGDADNSSVRPASYSEE